MMPANNSPSTGGCPKRWATRPITNPAMSTMLRDSSMPKTYSAEPVRALVFVLLAGCSVVKMSRVEDSWQTTDRLTLKRVAVVVQPLPGGDERVGAMFAPLARRYVHQKKEFLLVSDAARAAPAADKAADCVEHVD